jgi:HprK-related kinase B
MNLLERVRRTHAPEHDLALSIQGTPILVTSNDRSLIERLGDYFSPYVVASAGSASLLVYALQGDAIFDPCQLIEVPRPGSPRGPKESFYDTFDVRVIHKTRTGVTLYVSEIAHAIAGDLRAHFNQVVNAITMVFAKSVLNRGFGMLHASAVCGPRGGVAFASASGSGKSTCALALVEAGHRFVTNDRLLIKARGSNVHMNGVPKMPRVNPGTLLQSPRLARLLSASKRETYAALDRGMLWRIEDKYDVDVDRVYGTDTFQLAGRLRAIFFLHWGLDQDGWDVRELDGAERLAEMRLVAKTLGVYDTDPARDIQQRGVFERAAERIAAFSVRGKTDVHRLKTWVLENL